MLLVVFLVGWRMVGPHQLGGTAAYVTTHGNSMEPEYHQGDLVILRQRSLYRTGDIIGYNSPVLGRTILHRIHDEDAQGFITKGDNNSWLDSDRPKSADVIGKAWLHVPAAGKWLAKTRSPAVATTLIALVALTFFFGNEKKKRRAKKGKGPQLARIAFGSFTDQQKTWLAVPVGLLLAFLLLTAISFRQPLVSAISSDAAYEHVGTFDYSADVEKNPVYPTGKVEPGRPIFLRLVDSLDVSFTYRLKTEVDHQIAGQAALLAQVKGATGWTKTIPLQTLKTFKGDEVRLSGTLQFAQVQNISQRVQKITGLPESGQTVELSPRVTITGDMAGQEVSEQFAPSLAMQIDTFQVQLVAGDAASSDTEGAATSLRQTQPGEVKISETQANDLRLLGLSLDIKSTRMFGLAASLLALIALGLLWTRFSNPAHADEASLIETQYGEWLIPVESMRAQSQHKAVQVKSIAALVRLAELYERMILHENAEGIHSYFVEEEGLVYYYQALNDQSPVEVSSATAVTGPTRPKFSGRKLREERRKEEAARLKQELTDIEAEVLREKAGPTEN